MLASSWAASISYNLWNGPVTFRERARKVLTYGLVKLEDVANEISIRAQLCEEDGCELNSGSLNQATMRVMWALETLHDHKKMVDSGARSA